MSLLSPYLDHFHQFIKQRNDSNTVKRVINRVTELLIKKCLIGENYKKYHIEQNQRSYKEYCFACVNVESTFKLLLMRRFTKMIDYSSPCFSAKSVARVKKISAHHTFRVQRKALTSNLFSFFGYLSFRGLMRGLLGGFTCPRLISFGKGSLRLLGRALLAI